MSDIRQMASDMARIAMREGEKLGFTTSANLCRKMAIAFRERSAENEAQVALSCAEMIDRMRDHTEPPHISNAASRLSPEDKK